MIYYFRVSLAHRMIGKTSRTLVDLDSLDLSESCLWKSNHEKSVIFEGSFSFLMLEMILEWTLKEGWVCNAVAELIVYLPWGEGP